MGEMHDEIKYNITMNVSREIFRCVFCVCAKQAVVHSDCSDFDIVP